MGDNIDTLATGPHGIIAVALENKDVIPVFKVGQDGSQVRHQLNLRNCGYPLGVAVRSSGKFMVARRRSIDLYSTSGTLEKEVKHNVQNEDYTCSFAYTRDSNKDEYVFIGEKYDETIMVRKYETKSHKKLEEKTLILQHKVEVGCTEHSPHQITPIIGLRYLAVSNLNSRVLVYKLPSTTHPYQHHELSAITAQKLVHIDVGNPTALCYDEATDCLLIGRKDAEQDAEDGAVIEQYCWRTGAKIATIARGLKDPRSMAFTPDGMLAVADDKTIKFYRATVDTLDYK